MKGVLINSVIYIVENSSDEKKRVETLKALQKDFCCTNRGFIFLENLLISDLNPKIRKKAAELLGQYCLPNALQPIKWALQNDNSLNCVIKYVEIIKNYNKTVLKLFLIKEIEHYINNYKRFQPKLENFVLFNCELDELIEIFLNYKVLNYLIIIFPNLIKEHKAVLIQEGIIKRFDLKNKNIKKIKEIEGLDLLKHLEELNLSFNDVSEINGLKNLIKLRNLNLSHNKITKIVNLENLTELNSLNLGFNKIENIQGLKNAKKLKSLNIMHNKIMEFNDLTQVQSLETINLSKNLISKINGLENFKNLKSLDLTLNNIPDISKLDKYKKNINLILYGNPFNTYDPGL